MYRLVRFGELSLAYYNQVDVIGSGETPTHFIHLPDGGAIDGFGNLQKHPGVTERAKKIRLIGFTEAELSARYFRLLAMRGKRDRLFRRLPNNLEHWQWARLISIDAERRYDQARFKRIQDIELRFVSGEAFWHGAAAGTLWYINDDQYFNSGLYLNTSAFALTPDATTSLEIIVGSADDPGRSPVRVMTIFVTAGDTDITSLVIERAGGEGLAYLGTIPAGESLVINTGTLQVTLNGEDAYHSCFYVNVTELGSWFALLPGQNDVTVRIEGGGSGAKIDFVFYEAWY